MISYNDVSEMRNSSLIASLGKQYVEAKFPNHYHIISQYSPQKLKFELHIMHFSKNAHWTVFRNTTGTWTAWRPFQRIRNGIQFVTQWGIPSLWGQRGRRRKFRLSSAIWLMGQSLEKHSVFFVVVVVVSFQIQWTRFESRVSSKLHLNALHRISGNLWE